MAPKPAETVEYNHEGTWVYALIVALGEGGPGNFDLLANIQGGEWEPFDNVPQGTESGHWR